MEETKNKEKVLKPDFCATMQNYTYSVTGKRWNLDDTKLAYEAFIASLKALLLAYGKVQFIDFGIFEIVTRNPKKMLKFGKEEIVTPERSVLRFKVSDTYKEKVRNIPYKFTDGGEE